MTLLGDTRIVLTASAGATIARRAGCWPLPGHHRRPQAALHACENRRRDAGRWSKTLAGGRIRQLGDRAAAPSPRSLPSAPAGQPNRMNWHLAGSRMMAAERSTALSRWNAMVPATSSRATNVSRVGQRLSIGIFIAASTRARHPRARQIEHDRRARSRWVPCDGPSASRVRRRGCGKSTSAGREHPDNDFSPYQTAIATRRQRPRPAVVVRIISRRHLTLARQWLTGHGPRHRNPGP